ncbi:hypothetical protein [Silvibacterium sp.]|uniref:hypothetical protein n=1 Tax=Silvibacterium sp. TaxID=1964179 RepID=UPI0039E64434
MDINSLRVIREEKTEADGVENWDFVWEMDKKGRTQRFTIAQQRTDTGAAYTMHTRMNIETVGEVPSPEKINLVEITIEGVKGEISESGATRHDFMTITTITNGGFTTRESHEADVRLDLGKEFAGMDTAAKLRMFMNGGVCGLPGTAG